MNLKHWLQLRREGQIAPMPLGVHVAMASCGSSHLNFITHYIHAQSYGNGNGIGDEYGDEHVGGNGCGDACVDGNSYIDLNGNGCGGVCGGLYGYGPKDGDERGDYESLKTCVIHGFSDDDL